MFAKDKIVKQLIAFNELTVKEIVDKLDMSKQMVHIALKRLLEEGRVQKLGRTPKTIYRLVKESNVLEEAEVGYENLNTEREFLQKNFLLVSDSGELMQSIEAFNYWCKQSNLPFHKTLNEFIETKKKYEKYYDKTGLIDGTEKLMSTKGYDHVYLNKLFYLDFYAIERFGKTRLGTLLHYAKQGQNKFLMRIMMDEINKRIRDFVKLQKADAIAFVPPTIRREVQVMKFIQTQSNIALPIIDLKKISGIIPVPQKSLSKLDERIRNAENTFAITDQRKFNHVVMIDDAVGSGATLNQIAGKLLNKQTAKKVTGLAIVGSFKGFDVITDV